MPSLANKILRFNRDLKFEGNIPGDIQVMEPFQDDKVFQLCKKFYTKYYNDNKPRHLIIGINPGRFGGGTTGIPFTDPIILQEICGIENDLPKKRELSADFIYQMIAEFGSVDRFYEHFLFTSVSPLGFTRDGKNINYYDDKLLQQEVRPFAIQCINAQLDFGLNRSTCFCLGEGKNYDFLTKLNDSERFFTEIVPLSHPRFIMQYRSRILDQYIADYLSKLNRALST